MSGHRALLLSIGMIAAAVAGLEPSAAEMITLKEGPTQVGLVKSENSSAIRLVTGTPSGLEEVSIPLPRVDHRYRGDDERRQIGECEDYAVLERWTAGYCHAGLEDLADRCFERILEVNPSCVAEPRVVGAELFRGYWNRAVFQRRTAAIDPQNSAELLHAARWARKAGLTEEARDYLRRAYVLDRESMEITPLAVEWGVRLDPWLRLDLTPALQAPLCTDGLQDESTAVAPQKDMVFLSLPFRYTPDPTPRTLTRNSFHGRDMQGFYGFRTVALHNGRPVPDARLDSDAVYERIEIRLREQPEPAIGDSSAKVRAAGPHAQLEMLCRNSVGPRQMEGQEEKRAEPVERFRTLPASGWLLAVVEIPKNLKRFTLEWPDGVKEEIDLDFLNLVRTPLSSLIQIDEATGTPATTLPPGIAAMLQKLTGSSAAMAELALMRLVRLHEENGAGSAPPWMSAVDAAVLSAGALQDEDLRTAAWSYFTAQTHVSPDTMAYLGRQPRYLQRRWVELIDAEVRNRPSPAPGSAREAAGGHDELPPGSASAKRSSTVAVDLLGAVLRSNNESICDTSLEVLMGLGDGVDWGLAESASETSQTLALAKLERLTDRAAAERLLRAIMKDVRPSTASQLAEHARRLQIRIDSPDDPLLSQWPRAPGIEHQLGLLVVLQAVDLGDLLYSQTFADLLDDATADRTSGLVREAAYRMLISQVERRREQQAAEERRRMGTSRPAEPGEPGEFPTLVSIQVRDPVLAGLTAAVEHGAREEQEAALAALLLMGYAEEAERSLLESTPDQDARDALLTDLVASHQEITGCDGLLALLGRLLRKDYQSTSEFVLTHLRNVIAGPGRHDRWRILAAIKTGVDFARFEELGGMLRPLPRLTQEMLLNELCHMSIQDQRRYQALRDTAEQGEALKHIDYRRGYLVDGRYGVLAILETTTSEGRMIDGPDGKSVETHYRWRVPQRMTIVLPPVTLAADDQHERYRVLWDTRVIGEGRVKSAAGIQLPAKYSRRLEEPGPAFVGRKGWGWPALKSPIDVFCSAVGPAVLGERRVPSKLAPGTMIVDLSSYLRAALRSQRVFGSENVDKLIPEPYKVALRYAAFGSFYGAGERRAFPPQEKTVIGQRHLLNIMLVMERLDDADVGSPTTQPTATSSRTDE